MEINNLLEKIEMDSKFIFDLQRRTGKRIYLEHGNEMVNANDRLHHAPKAILMAHLRELGGLFGQKFRRQNNMKAGESLYSEAMPCHIMAVINPPTRAKMDTPNWYPTVKGLLDGMTDVGIFSDDNDEVVKSITFIPGELTRDGKYHIELIIVRGESPPIFKQMTFNEALEQVD